MPWLQVLVVTDRQHQATVESLLGATGALAITATNASAGEIRDSDYAESGDWALVSLAGLYPPESDTDGLTDQLSGFRASGSQVRVTILEEQDWEQHSRRQLIPIKAGPGLWVCPSWCAPPSGKELVVFIDPGLAFGTGHHATTLLCLDYLARYPLEGLDVIDYGCGSGILAISALRRGARCAWGIDIDPRAVVVSRQNARRNGVAERYVAIAPDELPEGLRVDLVVANIFFGALCEVRPRLTGLVNSRGRILLSGVLSAQAAPVVTKYAPDFDFEILHRDGWSLLVGERRAE